MEDGRSACEQRGDRAQYQDEEQDAAVPPEIEGQSELAGRKQIFERAVHPRSEGYAGRAAGEREHQALGKHLAGEAASRRAEGKTSGELFFPGGCFGEEEV